MQDDALQDDLGAPALHAIDKLLSERPEKVGPDFSEATRRVVAYRDRLVAIWRKTRSETDRHRMAQANAVLSVVVGSQFAISAVPWPCLVAARDQLARLLDQPSGLDQPPAGQDAGSTAMRSSG
jgi:hypothetical protein